MATKGIIDPEYSTQIGARLRFVRESLGLTQAEVAESIFASSQSILNLELGRRSTKTMCHHLMLVYYDYFYNCRHDQEIVAEANVANIESSLDYVENYLYGEEG